METEGTREVGFTPRGLVTITSDFGSSDGYVGAMKGMLLSIDITLRLHDVAHEVPPQDVSHAAHVLLAACPCFPRGTVHLAVVDPGVGGSRAPLALGAGGHAFVGPDNGIFDLAAERLGGPDWVRRIDPDGPVAAFLPATRSSTFHGRDLFAPVAGALAAGRLAPEDIGPRQTRVLLERSVARPEGGGIIGEVTHHDRFGNAITNLSRSDAHAAMEAMLDDGRRPRFVETYAVAAPGELVALIGSEGRVEIAVRDGSALAAGIARGTAIRLARGGPPPLSGPGTP